MLRALTLITVGGDQTLNAPDELTLEQGLRAFRYPPSLFQAYVKEGEILRTLPLHTKISTIPVVVERILRSTRNTDLESILPQETIL